MSFPCHFHVVFRSWSSHFQFFLSSSCHVHVISMSFPCRFHVISMSFSCCFHFGFVSFPCPFLYLRNSLQKGWGEVLNLVKKKKHFSAELNRLITTCFGLNYLMQFCNKDIFFDFKKSHVFQKPLNSQNTKPPTQITALHQPDLTSLQKKHLKSMTRQSHIRWVFSGHLADQRGGWRLLRLERLRGGLYHHRERGARGKSQVVEHVGDSELWDALGWSNMIQLIPTDGFGAPPWGLP